MGQHFDLIVLGTGAGASTVARSCRKAGWSVAIVDERPYGGTCALRGCDPKKVLVAVAEVADRTRRLRDKGLASTAGVRWPELMRFKRTFTEPVPAQREKTWREAGVATHHGHARFAEHGVVAVGEDVLKSRYVHVATGAKPRPLDIAGVELVSSSDDFLELDELPRRIAFIGAGYVSMELAHVAAIAGAEVTILHRGARPLERFDPDLVNLLVDRTRALGIDLRLRTSADAVERHANALRVTGAGEAGTIHVDCDLAVHGAGRVPAIDDLALEAAGVEYDQRGIAVNDYMQSRSNGSVYAAGDAAAGGLPLTPVASYEARIAAHNLLHDERRAIEYPPTPSVVFTSPPLASVGLGVAEARERGLRFELREGDTSGWHSSRRAGSSHGGYRILIGEDDGRILGAHILGPDADAIINLFSLAMHGEVTRERLSDTLFAYPTIGSDLSSML